MFGFWLNDSKSTFNRWFNRSSPSSTELTSSRIEPVTNTPSVKCRAFINPGLQSLALNPPKSRARKNSQQQSTASIVAACKRCVVAQGRKPTAPHPPARWAASAQFTNTTCHIEPPKDPFNRRLHQLRLDRIYSSWLTNYSPPKRPAA